MNIETIQAPRGAIAVLSGGKVQITDAGATLDLAMSVRYETGASRLAIDKRLVCSDFFILSTGVAGDILQKLMNYRFKAAHLRRLLPLRQQAAAGLYPRVQSWQRLLFRVHHGGGRPAADGRGVSSPAAAQKGTAAKSLPSLGSSACSVFRALRFRPPLLRNGLTEHLLRLADGLLQRVLSGVFGIAALHCLPLLRVLDPPVDPLGQRVCVPGREQAPLIQGELGRGGPGGIGDHRHQAAGKCLHTAHSLDLRVGGVDVQIRHVEDLQQAGRLIELHDDGIGELLRQTAVFFLQRTLSCQDHLDLPGVAGLGAGVDQLILTLFPGVAAHISTLKRPCIQGSFSRLP